MWAMAEMAEVECEEYRYSQGDDIYKSVNILANLRAVAFSIK
jgi:hypothetical protein